MPSYDDSEEMSKEEASSSAIALIPKAAFMGKKYEVGDTIKFKVTAIRGDEVEVECSGGEDESEEPETSEEPEEMTEEVPQEEIAPPSSVPTYEE